ncbi:MAG: hypothetical protein IIY36_02820, partial [Lachnospiraceae bacterium]|nr:hypothetical protein [Lachnospiraceae bacterium]
MEDMIMDEFEKNGNEEREEAAAKEPERAEIEYPEEPGDAASEPDGAEDPVFDFAAVMDDEEAEPEEFAEAGPEEPDESVEPAEMPEPEEAAEEPADEPVEFADWEDDPEPEEDAGESEPAEVPETADTSEEPLEPQDPPAEEPAGTPAEEPDTAAEKKMTRAEKKEKRKAEKAEKAARPRRSDRLGFRVGVRLIAVLIVILLALGAFYFGYSIFNQKPVTESGDPTTYVITV